jgi:uncharacterized DUF497 family protein
MPICEFIWDESEDGNVAHPAEHGVTPEEAAYVVEQSETRTTSRSTGLTVAFGYTPSHRFLIVVYERVAEDTVYVHTGYDVPPATRRK